MKDAYKKVHRAHASALTRVPWRSAVNCCSGGDLPVSTSLEEPIRVSACLIGRVSACLIPNCVSAFLIQAGMWWWSNRAMGVCRRSVSNTSGPRNSGRCISCLISENRRAPWKIICGWTWQHLATQFVTKHEKSYGLLKASWTRNDIRTCLNLDAAAKGLLYGNSAVPDLHTCY